MNDLFFVPKISKKPSWVFTTATTPQTATLTSAANRHVAHVHIQPRFLQTILDIETQGEGSEEMEREVVDMFAEESTMIVGRRSQRREGHTHQDTYQGREEAG